MDIAQLDIAISKLPRRQIGFYPTPFHALRNLSARYGVNFHMKREDLAGPGAISGSKTRLSEFILGRALEQGVTHVITQGVYLTNSGLQFAAACRIAGLTPILFLTRDATRRGEIGEYRGNLLLNKAMDVETHFFITNGGAYWDAEEDLARIKNAMQARKEELEADGHRVLIVPTGGAHEDGFVAHALTFTEMLRLELRRNYGLRPKDRARSNSPAPDPDHQRRRNDPGHRARRRRNPGRPPHHHPAGP